VEGGDGGGVRRSTAVFLRELEKSANPFALVMLAAKAALLAGKVPETELLDRKVAIGVGLMRKGFSVRVMLWVLMNM
jgi:hypothetical protein